MHFNLPGHAHELTFSCYRRKPLLSSETTITWLLQAIEADRHKRGFHVYAFVIMPEHVHIIIHPHESASEISWFLKSMKQPVARKVSRWLSGHDPQMYDRLCIKRKDGRREFRFWQAGGGYDRNIENPETLIQMIDYIHQNPVRRGLVEQAADWKWSSASWYDHGEGMLRMDESSLVEMSHGQALRASPVPPGTLIRTFGVTCSYCRICRINVIQLYESNREADTECLSGTSDTNIAFKDLCRLLIYLGFDVRTKGSHHIFRKAGVEEKINLQKDGNKAKPYQVKQVRAVILTYKLGGVK